MKNPYDVLGVKEEDSDEVINKAYKKLARQYHPDINPSPEAAEKMVEINCAYDEIKKMREQGIKFSSYNNSIICSSVIFFFFLFSLIILSKLVRLTASEK